LGGSIFTLVISADFFKGGVKAVFNLISINKPIVLILKPRNMAGENTSELTQTVNKLLDIIHTHNDLIVQIYNELQYVKFLIFLLVIILSIGKFTTFLIVRLGKWLIGDNNSQRKHLKFNHHNKDGYGKWVGHFEVDSKTGKITYVEYSKRDGIPVNPNN